MFAEYSIIIVQNYLTDHPNMSQSLILQKSFFLFEPTHNVMLYYAS